MEIIMIMFNSTDNATNFGSKIKLYDNPTIDMSDSFWCNGYNQTIFCTGTDYGSSSNGDYCLYKSTDYGSNWGAEDCHTPVFNINGCLDSSNAFDKTTDDIFFVGSCGNGSLSTSRAKLIYTKHNGSWQTEVNLTELYYDSSGEDRYYMPHASRFIYEGYLDFVTTNDNDKNLTYFGINVSVSEAEADESKGLINITAGAIPFYTNSSSNPIALNLSQDECSNITFWVNATGTIDNTYTFFGTASSDIVDSINSSEINITITSEAPPEDTCTCPASGNWNIQCSDNCNIQACDMQTNNVLLNGTGKVLGLRNITDATRIRIQQGCIARW